MSARTAPAGRAPWTLRRRLVLTIVALLAIVGVTVGGISIAALGASLMSRLDQQVTAGLGFSGLVGPTPPSGQDDGPQRRVGTLVLVITDSAATGEYTTEDGTVVDLTDAQIDRIRATGILEQTGTDGSGGARSQSDPASVDLGGDLGLFRVAARELQGGAFVVSGLSQAEVTDTLTSLAAIFAGVLLAALVAAGVLSAGIVRIALRPLDRVAATAIRVSERPLASGAVTLPERVPDADADDRTEVGQVGASLNRLLGHVEASLMSRQESEETLRRFIADASHELRTPLASIRGYAELSQRVEEELPPDVQRAVERIGSESIRMTSLVEDLLLLARLDAGQRLDAGTVDLTMLLADAVSDAHVVGRDHHWLLDLAEDVGAVEVPGDAHRLHQVVANLLANARTHTPAGTTVTASLAVEGAEAVIRIADDGPGIAPDLRDRLFERFVRGEASRSRAAGSTGLGLSIVQAIAASHGGTVAVASTPADAAGGSGGSTVFEVRLPRA